VVDAVLSICAREPGKYRVVPPSQGGAPCVLLVQEPSWFDGWVDVDSLDDTYSWDVWDSLATFLRDSSVQFPSDPYAAAVELRQRNLPHLQQLSLGELEHIFNLAHGRRHLLARYRDVSRPARVVRQLEAKEFSMSGRPAREQGARRGVRPACSDIASNSIVGEEDLAAVLMQLMQRFPNGARLMSIKSQVRSLYTESPARDAFMCARVAEMFKLSHTQAHDEVFPAEHAPFRTEAAPVSPKPETVPPHLLQRFREMKVEAHTELFQVEPDPPRTRVDACGEQPRGSAEGVPRVSSNDCQ